jgi:hypothetical protein
MLIRVDDRSSDALFQSNIRKFFQTGLQTTCFGNAFPVVQIVFSAQTELKLLKSAAMLVCVEHDACKTDHRYWSPCLQEDVREQWMKSEKS